MSSDVWVGDLELEGTDIERAEEAAAASKSWRRTGWHLLGARIPEDLYERLSWGSYRKAVSINTLLSAAAEEYLDRYGIEEPPEEFVRRRRAERAATIAQRERRRREEAS